MAPKPAHRWLLAGLVIILVLLATALVTTLIFPVVRGVQECRSDGPMAVQRLERYVKEIVGEDLIRDNYVEVCDSTVGVSYDAVLQPTVRFRTVVDAFEAVGCQSYTSAPGVFSCTAPGTPTITIDIRRDTGSLRVHASTQL